MKVVHSFLSIVLIIIVHFAVSNYVLAQNNHETLILSSIELKILELVIEDQEITHKLDLITIANNQWIEYDNEGKEIGKADITKNLKNEIRIKWISASNGAKPDAITIYKFTKKGGEYKFDIYFDDKLQGYFLATRN